MAQRLLPQVHRLAPRLRSPWDRWRVTNIGAWKVILLRRERDRRSDGEMATLVLVQDPSEDGGRIKVWNAVALN